MKDHKIVKAELDEILPLKTVLNRFRLNEDLDYYDDTMAYLKKAYNIGKPLAVYVERYIDEANDDEIIIAGVKFKGPLISEKLCGIHKVYPYAATCGVELDELAAKETDPLIAYYAHDFNQHVAGLMTGKLLAQVKLKTGSQKMSSINPGSLPGWPISEQKKLFKLFDGANEDIGLALTPSCLMVPVKSLSGILFTSSEEWFNCMRCDRKNCPGRKAPFENNEFK